jgi:TonB family protein
MDETLIYRKTKRGATELTATHGALSSPERRVLILLDGQRTLAELAELFGAESVDHIVADLEAQGFVRQVDPDNVLTTQSIPPTPVTEPRLMPIEPPPTRRGSTWIALGLLVAAAATASGGYWFFLRPNHAGEPVFALASASFAGASTVLAAPGLPAPDEPPAVRVVALSGLPPVTVTPARRAAAAESAAPVEVVQAAAIVPAEAAGQGRRSNERAAPAVPTTLLAAAKPTTETESASDAGSLLNQPTSQSAATRATATPTTTSRPDARAVDAPVGDLLPPAFGPGGEPAPPATAAAAVQAPPTIGTSAGGTSPAAAAATSPAPPPAAGKAPPAPLGEQVASLAPPPRPQSAPVQLHQRKHDPPEFPVRAVRAKIYEGHVLAHIWITPEGKVEQVDIVKAAPPRLFDDAVKTALSAWTFDPPGRAVDTTIELDFKP